ncbi:hypothetical protein RWH44_07535 [Microbacterium sp. KSW2-29]|uniref:Transglutaminase n=1 Tax=Microbacterium phycohabitans TaxID=3075993 RepID=A0ABU3SL81_9MICO|nr:hypothetical protein [Microbacterium sp. KSW2-29]MDU0345554.1 hypothetical protein [Microbacterium sp. KSW2-29]
MTRTADPRNSSQSPTLHWWAAAAAALVLVLPLPEGSTLIVQMGVLIFGIVVLCIVRGRPARSVAATVVVVIGLVVGIQVVGHLAALFVDRSFTDDAVVIG